MNEHTAVAGRQAGKQGMPTGARPGRHELTSRLPELFIACVAASAEVASLVPGDGAAS